jgi:hypothetical protein
LADALVRRSGDRAGAWSALLPASWRRLPCARAGSSTLAQTLCSSEGGDTDLDVWYAPGTSAERFVVITCRGGGCSPLRADGAPRVSPPAGATAGARLSAWEVGFSVPAGKHFLERSQDGPLAITGLLLASHAGTTPAYPVLTAATSLPASEGELAAAILDSFAVG